MKCGCCGKDIGEFTFDISYQMPDEIWALEESERDERAQIDSDLARLDDRYFVRGVIFIPIHGSHQQFGWGIWVEIPESKFHEYVKNYSGDNSSAEPFSGRVANSLPYYPETLGVSVNVRFGNETQRPTFEINEPSHLLHQEQAAGIELQRVHEFNKKSQG